MSKIYDSDYYSEVIRKGLCISFILEDTAHYAGLLLAPAEDFGLWPRAIFALWANKGLLCCFGQDIKNGNLSEIYMPVEYNEPH